MVTPHRGAVGRGEGGGGVGHVPSSKGEQS